MGLIIGLNGGGGGAANAVKYTPQTLTEPQKAQARANIDASKDIPVSSPASASSYELAVDTLIQLGTLTGAITLTLGTAPSDGKVHLYHLVFTADSNSAPTITWPSGITWSGSAPTITAGKTYEVSIMSGMALAIQY